MKWVPKPSQSIMLPHPIVQQILSMKGKQPIRYDSLPLSVPVATTSQLSPCLARIPISPFPSKLLTSNVPLPTLEVPKISTPKPNISHQDDFAMAKAPLVPSNWQSPVLPTNPFTLHAFKEVTPEALPLSSKKSASLGNTLQQPRSSNPLDSLISPWYHGLHGLAPTKSHTCL